MTARPLKYSHNNVCPANENKHAPKSKKVKRHEPQEDVIIDVKDDQPQPPTNRAGRIKKWQEKSMCYFLLQFKNIFD